MALFQYFEDRMQKLKEVIQSKISLLGDLVQHPNFQKRLKWELIEIEVQDLEDYFIELYEKNIKHSINENNLLVCKILGICDEVDLDGDPSTKMGEFPDVDVDYLKVVRDYLKNEWAPKTFGTEKVCNIGNYGTFGLKSTLIDMARVHGLDRGEILNITTNLKMKDDEGELLTYDSALRLYPQLKEYCEKHPEIATATQKLLHRNRSMGKHAGGLILCNQRIDNFVPLVRGSEGETVSSWVEGLHGQDLGPVGLIKFDLLVVNSLWQICLTVRLVKSRNNIQNICAAPNQWDWSDDSYLNDPKSMEMANRGDLRCVFQYDSDGIRKLVRKGGVESFDDLVAYVSLYRPSTLEMGMDETYCLRKRGKQIFEIPEILQDVVGKTYGVLVYQEQIMQILSIVGKIALRDCYQVIKAISKKKVDGFKKYKDKFIENGQQTLGRTPKEMEEYWELIESFAGYGFNKSVTEDTIIYCVDGPKQIKHICAGDKVFCVNEKGEQEQTEVVAVYDHGVIDVVEVTFDDGYSVKCTLDHKFLTEEGQVPLWKIIKNNLGVLSFTFEEQNAKETKLGSELWGDIQQQEENRRTSQELSEVQRDISTKEKGKVQSQGSLWSKIPKQIQISRSFERMSGLHLFEVEGDRQEAYIPLWNRIFTGEAISRPSSSLREMYKNQKEEYSGKDGQIKRMQSISRNKGNIFSNSQENFCTKRCATSQNSTIEEMEGQQSRSFCQSHRKGCPCAKKIENGNVVKTASWMETEENTLWQGQKICGFGQEEDLDRSGRSISFLAGWFNKQQTGAQFEVCAKQRSNSQGRMFAEKGCNANKIEHEMFYSKDRRNQSRMVGCTPEYASISSTRNLVSRRVLRIMPVGKRQCYDLEVAVSTHNFILPNGVVTSNSHATSYSVISARQLYLKAHYPLEFYTATLMCEQDDAKLREYITEAENHGVEVCGIDINKSKDNFSILDGKIYIGFGNIKGIGEDKAKRIVEGQPYSSFEDFLFRFGTEAAVLKALISLGVFKDAPAETLYKFWIHIAEYQKKIRDKTKRNELSKLKIIDELRAELPEQFPEFNNLSDDICAKISLLGFDYVNILQKYKKKLNATIERYNKTVPTIPILRNFDPNSVEVDDKKVLELCNDIKQAEITFYGFIWHNPLRSSPDYRHHTNIENFKLLVESGRNVGVIIVEILEVAVKSFKNNKGKFASIQVIDDNFETARITMWEDDYTRFKEDLKKGNFISIQVTPPSNGFSSFTFYGPPRHERYKLPNDRNKDLRLCILRKV